MPAIQARDRYWEKKAAKQAKSQMQCLERSLKQTLQRQKTLMETVERCRYASCKPCRRFTVHAVTPSILACWNTWLSAKLQHPDREVQ